MKRQWQTGKARQRLELQQLPATPVVNRSNEPVQAWTTVAKPWGSVESLSGVELWNAQQVVPDATVRVVIRYYPGVSCGMRFLLGGTRALNIRSISDPEERHIELVCLCGEAAA